MTDGVKFVGNPEDHTGYGRAGLYMLDAMHSAGIPVVLKTINFIREKIELPVRISSMKQANINYNTVIVELTPEHFPIYKEDGKFNIGYFFWETDRIPMDWVKCCNQMDEIWVPCQSNKDACIRSGVVTRVRVVPQPTPLPTHNKKIWIPGTDSSTYIFYSIFQWTERKNPQCLLRAYWRAFHKKENVILLLKSYISGDGDNDIQTIKNSILQYRGELATKYSVPVNDLGRIYFLSKILTDDHIERLQNSGHCFVTAARGEGWNIPAAMAVQLGQPLISPSYGGIVDFMDEGNYYSVQCNKMIPVFGMPWIKWYESKQKWCDPSEQNLANHMRTVFDQNIRAVNYGSIAKDFSVEAVGQQIKRLLSAKQ